MSSRLFIFWLRFALIFVHVFIPTLLLSCGLVIFLCILLVLSLAFVAVLILVSSLSSSLSSPFAFSLALSLVSHIFLSLRFFRFSPPLPYFTPGASYCVLKASLPPFRRPLPCPDVLLSPLPLFTVSPSSSFSPDQGVYIIPAFVTILSFRLILAYLLVHIIALRLALAIIIRGIRHALVLGLRLAPVPA